MIRFVIGYILIVLIGCTGTTQTLTTSAESVSPTVADANSAQNDKKLVDSISTLDPQESCSFELQDKGNTDVYEDLARYYSRHMTLYTGGLHYKELDNVLGSVYLYLALDDQFELLDDIASRTQAELSNGRMWFENSKLHRFNTWRESNKHDRDPVWVLRMALRVIDEGAQPFSHLSADARPHTAALIQASHALDEMTQRGEPMDWWLKDDFPKGYGKLQHAVWYGASRYDLIDWLQFIVTTSTLNHLMNWSFENSIEDREAFKHLQEYAYKQWKNTNSYVWLAALGEISEPGTYQAKAVIDAFDKLNTKFRSCMTSRTEDVAHGVIYSNAVRLAYGSGIDAKSWLTPLNEEEEFSELRQRVNARLVRHRIAKEVDIDVRSVIESLLPTNESKRDLYQIYFATLLGDELREILEEDKFIRKDSLTLATLGDEIDLLRIASSEKIDLYIRRSFMRAAFIRTWVKRKSVSDSTLHLLKQLEPSLESDIQSILTSTDSTTREALILKLVMQSPGMRYVPAVPLFREWWERSEIKQFASYNSLDGNWWCSRDRQQLQDRFMDKAVRPFGFAGSDPYKSGGRHGAVYENPGQKRQSRRRHEGYRAVVTDKVRHEQLKARLANSLERVKTFGSSEWDYFDYLPNAVVYFSENVAELERRGNLNGELMFVLYSSLNRASRRACRNEIETYDVRKKSAQKMKYYQGLITNT